MAEKILVNVQDLILDDAYGALFDFVDELDELLSDYKVSFIHDAGENMLMFERCNAQGEIVSIGEAGE